MSSRPDIVIVEGGGNDVSYPQDSEQASATRLLRSLRQRLPKAKIVLVGPVWTKQEVDPGLPDIRSALKLSAGTVGVMWVDPTGWFSGRAELMGSSGAHLTDQGHAFLAGKIDAGLLGLGIQ